MGHSREVRDIYRQLACVLLNLCADSTLYSSAKKFWDKLCLQGMRNSAWKGFAQAVCRQHALQRRDKVLGQAVPTRHAIQRIEQVLDQPVSKRHVVPGSSHLMPAMPKLPWRNDASQDIKHQFYWSLLQHTATGTHWLQKSTFKTKVDF